MSVESEVLLEPFLRRMRFEAGRKYLKSGRNILDFGCGPNFKLLRYLNDNNFTFTKYTGFDPLVGTETSGKNFSIENKKMKLRGTFDLVTMFAVLEHVSYPDFSFDFLNKVTSKGTLIVLTTPTKLAKNILEFLSFKMGIVSRREIAEHQHYYTREEIVSKFKKYGFELVEYRLFEFGANSLCVLRKK